MSEKTLISWCDSTVNFWRGCDKVSAGCAHCYITSTPPFRTTGMKHGDPRVLSEGAFKLAEKLNRQPCVCDHCGTAQRGAVHRDEGCVNENCPSNLHEHLHGLYHRRRIFSLSLGDWLDDQVPVAWLARMLDTVRFGDQVIWILCSKRLENWRPRLEAVLKFQETHGPNGTYEWLTNWLQGRFPKQVWLLASVENQAMAEKRIPELLRIPAAVHGLSCEPLLEPISLPLQVPAVDGPARLDWLVIGGESGARARACNVEWIRSLVRQGKGAGIRVFVKQLGKKVVCRNDSGFEGETPREFPMDTHTRDLDPMIYQGAPVRVLLRHSKGADPAEWPPDLRVQEFPD